MRDGQTNAFWKRIKSKIKRTAEGTDSLFRLVMLWIFGDLIYAVLPIIVLAAITVLLGDQFIGFLQIKEWSFATIVFFGVSIREFVHLKVNIQQTPHSFKLDTGLQLFIVLLIASVLVLSLVILAEKNVLPKGHEVALGKAQITLFLIGVVSVLVSVFTRDTGLNWAYKASDREIPLRWLLKKVNRDLSEAEGTLSYLLYAVEHFPKDAPESSTCGRSNKRDEDREFALATGSLDRISCMAKEIEREIQSFVSKRRDVGQEDIKSSV